MVTSSPRRLRLGVLLAAPLFAALSLPSAGQDFDEDAAESLARKSSCLRCHSVEKRKKAPSYKEIAAKYRSRPDAEAVLLKHLSDSAVVTTEDGDDEEHATVKSDNKDEVLNVVRWVLTR